MNLTLFPEHLPTPGVHSDSAHRAQMPAISDLVRLTSPPRLDCDHFSNESTLHGKQSTRQLYDYSSERNFVSPSEDC